MAKNKMLAGICSNKKHKFGVLFFFSFFFLSYQPCPSFSLFSISLAILSYPLSLSSSANLDSSTLFTQLFSEKKLAWLCFSSILIFIWRLYRFFLIPTSTKIIPLVLFHWCFVIFSSLFASFGFFCSGLFGFLLTLLCTLLLPNCTPRRDVFYVGSQ